MTWTMPQPLPIDDVLPDLVAALRRRPSAVLRAPTGAGKTTRVPPALHDAGFGRVVMLEPRRLAARAAARRMARERGVALGGEVGYHVRFDRLAGRDTRILAVTPGILLRTLHDDPYLESVGVVVFDEFHERGLESDLALGLVRLIQQTVRPELRIVVMSATLDAAAAAAYLGCEVVASEGRQYPVTVRYEPKPAEQPWPLAVARAVERVLDETPGDVLAFLPGMREILQTAGHLAGRDVLVLPLHGDLPPEQQDAALARHERRKVVLATNVAETSVTVEGITAVVDSGLARSLEYDPAVGLDRLDVGPISKTSADQRAGRAGRLAPGLCVRLWSELSHRSRPDQTAPEVRRVDLAGAVLQLLALGETAVERFPWLEPPRTDTVERARLLLRRLGATDDRGLTPLGRDMARLPVHPRLGRMLIEGQRLGCAKRAATAAALLSERDPLPRHGAPTDSDVLDRVEALEANPSLAPFVVRARDQLFRSVERAPGEPPGLPRRSEPDGPLRALLAAFPDRVVKRRATGSDRGVMIGGRGVRLAPSCGVRDAELFVAVDVDAGETEALVRQASAVRRDWLFHVQASVEVAFDPSTERVSARRVTRYEDLVLEEVPAAFPNDETVAKVLADAASADLSRVLPPADWAAGLYRVRVRCLRSWIPELGLPAFDDPELRELIPELCRGCRSFADLRNADWLEAMQSRLTYPQRQAVENETPERIAVPSGSRIALRYEEGRPPVLAVRIQEVFGLCDTPRIAAGRVKVLLHLLAPNYRPQQVTDDLASFWANTYAQVRKELRARYPKHAWPEDPLSAEPRRRPGK